MNGVLFSKQDEQDKPKGNDDLKGAIPKGFEKFFKGGSKKGADENANKPSSASKEEKNTKENDKKTKEEG